MKLKGIKNIIFDLGGVLLNIDFNITKQAFVKLGITDFEFYHAKAKQNKIFDLFETGQFSEHEFCEQLRKLTNVPLPNNEIINAWNAMLLDFPLKRKELLLNLKQKFNLFALSNTNETHLRKFHKIIKKDIDETSLTRLFHACYFSNEIGFRKPNEAAFQFVLQANNLNPTETLFIDDTLENILAAQQLKFKTYHLNLSQNNNVLNLFNEY